MLAAIRWYLRELTGEAEYDHYVERHRRLHPEEPVLSRRDFERQRCDRRDHSPDPRCC
ncbi:hypothetical protein Pa4123_54240 [Phytohabitans aurantiacus]|uniref:DUF466 domain-containing protein n=1 Tax=Phytohabitans aurantiacus TaxID=3016789 RepID=A0ABQ5R1G4_9ACTN|nr:hypothetical protein Pa4123_54240 [Phytohabitans aurantiacus]